MTGFWLAKQWLGPVCGVKAQRRTPFGYARAQLHGSVPSQVSWRLSGPRSSMDVYTDTIMNHKRWSFTHIWQQGKRFWTQHATICLANKVSFGLWFRFRWDSPIPAALEQKELFRIYQKHESTSNMKPVRCARYAHYSLPNLIQVMVVPVERRCSVTTDYSTPFPKKQARGFLFLNIWLSYKPLGRVLRTEPKSKKGKK